MVLCLVHLEPPVSSQNLLTSTLDFSSSSSPWKSQLYFCLAIGCWAFYYTVHSNTSSHGAQIPQHETLKVYSWQQILCDAFLELGLFCLFEGSSMPDAKSLSPPSPSLSSCFLSVSIWSLQVRHATLRWYLIYLHMLIAPSVIPGVSLVKPLCDVCAPASCPHTQSVHLCLVVGILEVGRQSCLYLSPSLPPPAPVFISEWWWDLSRNPSAIFVSVHLCMRRCACVSHHTVFISEWWWEFLEAGRQSCLYLEFSA